MKFFAALKLSTYADAAFKAAGLDLEKLAAANDVDAIKTAVAAKAAPDAEANAAILAAKTENEELTAKLAAAESFKASAETLSVIVTGCEAAGFKPGETKTGTALTSATVTENFDLAVAKKARLMVAKAGHPGILDDVGTRAPDNKPAPAASTEQLTGRDRMAKSFGAQIRRAQQREREEDRN